MTTLSKPHSRFDWTLHAKAKLRQYSLSESRILRVIRHPARIEEGIAPDTVAVMQPSGSKRPSEIWVLYTLVSKEGEQQIRIITAWRYPGQSSEREPLPPEILREARSIIGS